MATSPQTSTVPLALRAANGLVLELLQVGRGPRDLTEALILTTIFHANVAPLAGNLRAQQRYATFYSPPPDRARRPITLNAIASALRLPPETVRARVAQLANEGVLDVSRRGVLFSEGSLRSPEHRAALERAYEVVRDLYLRLREAGAIAAMRLPSPTVELASPGARPLRIVARISVEYVLAVVDWLTRRLGDPADGLVLAALAIGPVRRGSVQTRGEGPAGPMGPLSDQDRTPRRIEAVAAALGLPEDLVRQRLLRLAGRGLCVPSGGDFVVPAEILGRAPVAEATGFSEANLIRMFRQLAELGVLALWDHEAGAAVAA